MINVVPSNLNYLSLIKGLLDDGILCEMNFLGNSMFPAIKNGSKLVVFKPNKVIVGSVYVYLYKDDNVLTAHRLVSIQGEKYFFKGDNRKYRDPWVTQERIIGEVRMKNI